MREKIYLYCMTSTPKQNVNRQVRIGKQVYPTGIVIEEIYDRKIQGRPKWKQLMEQIEKDVKEGYKVKVVFDSIERMAKTKEEGIKLYFYFYENGVDLEFMKEKAIDTEIYRQIVTKQSNAFNADGNVVDMYVDTLNKAIKEIATRQIEETYSVRQQESSIASEYTKESIEKARLCGKQLGHKKGQKNKDSEKKKKALEIIKRYKGKMPAVDIQNLAGISKDTYYRYCREMELIK